MNPYDQVLDATISHLEKLKASGIKHVKVSQEILSSLTMPSSRAVETRASASPAATSTASGRSTIPVTPKPVAVAPSLPQSKVSLMESMAEEIKQVRGEGEIPGEKGLALEQVKQRAMVCVKCPHLASSRRNVVFGVGNIDSPLMFVGEAPGMEEDQEGEPFVGVAGQLLTKIIKAMGFGREQIYIANVLKCRPNTPGQTAGNRKPSEEEMKKCLPYLLAQIEIIQPKIIVALGGTAVEGLFGKTDGISKIRGHLRYLRNIPVMPTFHPSYLLRQQMLTEKRKVWEDMMKVMEHLQIPITEKQQGFFLKA
ncbi:MAG: polymerase [Verrucomicrobiales bacterium]|nr:polymerase [Verrucomicrobiales bacterium]